MFARRRRWFVGAAIVFALICADNLRDPPRQFTARALVAAIDGYKTHLAPSVPSHCQFTPTCSQYARMAILNYGSIRGSLKAAWRIARCSPFTTRRGEDYP